MAKEKSDKADGGESGLARYAPLMIILGVVLAVGGIFLFCPNLWKNYYIPILFIAAGIAIPFLLSPWKFWAGYGFQVGIAPGLTFVLMGVFTWLFGYSTDGLAMDSVLKLIQVNSIILVVWLVLVLLVLKIRQKTWRDYSWIFSPAMLILIFLVNVSWAKPTLESKVLEKSRLVEIEIPNSNLKLYAEYPQQIIYDEQNTATVTLWGANNIPCDLKNIRLSSDALVFALESTDGSPFQWQRAIEIKMPDTDSMVVVHVKPLLMKDDVQEAFFEITINDEETQQLPPIRLEGRQEAQTRLWKSALLDAGSISVIISIVAAWIEIRRKEEEERRKKEEEINNALKEFDETMQNNFSASIDNWERLTRNWEKWDRVFQDQVRDKFSAFVEDNLWDAILGKTLEEIRSEVENCLKVCGRIFESEEAKPIHTLKQLQSALQQDGKALLSLVRGYSASITIAKRIVKSYPKEIKDDVLRKFNKEYKKEINLLARELGIPTEYPLLESLFWRYRRTIQDNEELKEWLSLHKLSRSPFADAITPFTSFSENSESFLIDLVSTGFSFDFPSDKQIRFRFNDAWDLRTAVYGFCKSLPAVIASNAFLVLVPPFLTIDYEKETTINVVLHALGEQWLNTITDEPAAFYDLNIHQQKVLARLLCWHYGSLHSVLARLSREIDNKYPLISSENQQNQEERKEKNARELLKKAPHWLEGTASTLVQFEEIPHLLDLRPSSTQRTFLLMPSVDLDFQATVSVSPEKYDVFDTIVDRLNIHNYTFIHFYLADQQWWRVEEEALTRIINERIKRCAIREDAPADQINSLNELFIPHEKEKAEKILAQKANGSPGRMVRLGQKLLLQHVQNHPPDDPLHIEDLEALEV